MAEIGKHVKRLAPHAAVVLASVALAVAASLLLEAGTGMAKELWFTGSPGWWLPTDALGPHTPIAWQSAILLAGALAWLLPRPAAASARARVLWSALAGLFAIVLVTTVVTRPTLMELGLPTNDPDAPSPIPWSFVLVFGAAAAAASSLARRAPAPKRRLQARRSPHRIAAAVLLAALSQVPSIADWIDEHESQSFPRFRLELVAAHPVADPGPAADPRDHAWAEGQVWSMDERDALVISDAEVERVRWIADPADGRPGISIRFDAPVAQAVRQRSIRRLGEHDALVVDGQTQMVPNIQAVLLDGTLALHVAPTDRGRLAELYERLTGRAAPPR